MSLSSALSSTLSGLRATQAQMEVVSGNIANADSAGYTRRVANLQEVGGPAGVNGVRINGVQRLLDTILQRELRTESAGSGYAATRTAFADRAQNLFGKPGSTSSLDSMLNEFNKSLQSLAADPSSSLTRSGVLTAAGNLARQLNSVSSGIQDLRTTAEQTIGADVTRVNELLAGIAASDKKVGETYGSNPALLDQRDAQINELSKLIDVKVSDRGNGTIALSTQAGLSLYDGGVVTTLSFDMRGALDPTSLYSTGASRGVGTITASLSGGGSIDVIGQGMIRSGEIAALVEMRDTVLVEAQAQVDELAAGLSTALSNRAVTGTVSTATPPVATIDLNALQPGNVFTLGVTDAGTGKTYSFVSTTAAGLPANATPDPNDIEVAIPFGSGAAGAAAAMQAALGAGYTVTQTGGVFSITGNGGTKVVNSAKASVTTTAFTGNGVELPLFSDGSKIYSGSFDNGSQKVGLAGRLTVNPAIKPADLVVYTAATPAGDTARADFIRNAIGTSQFTFSPGTGIGATNSPFTGTIGGFLRRVVDTQGSNAASAQRLDEGQQVVQASIESRFSKASGVSVDEELTNLVQIQNAYSANARLMTAIKEMMDLLMRI
jgi:flagellar hook-associated protein 1 FlgK